MTAMQMRNEDEVELSKFYDDRGELAAVVSTTSNHDYLVDFYKDEVIVDSRRLSGVSQRYADDMAENYAMGIIRLDSKTRRVNGI
jgi:hypothetical protein